ncbi:MAG: MFS transporter [Pseudomonadales bacterium]|nr:MFS transporter [Pseudomonadales bacterium]
MTKTEFRAAASIGLLYIVRMLGLFMVLPVLPVSGEVQSASPLLIGLALGVYGLSQALLQIPLGLLSDRIGRKPVILGGLVMFVAGSIVAGASGHIFGIIVGRLLQGCGAIASTLLALVSDVTSIENRSKAMAIVGISIGGSFGLALILGPLIANLGGLPAVFYFTAGAGLVGIVVVLTVLPNPTVRSHNPESSLTPRFITDVLANADLRRTTASVFMLHYLLMSSFIVLPVLLSQTGVEHDNLHWVYFGLLAFSFLLMTPLMWIADKPKNVRPLLLGMIGIFVGSQLLLTVETELLSVLSSLLLFFMAFNLLEVILPALVSKTSRAGQRGTGMGIYSTSQFAGGFAGGALGGAILAASDITHLLWANALACAIWFIYLYGISQPRNYKTIACRVATSGNMSASAVADALLSVGGVEDVAFMDDDRLAYLKVDEDIYDDEALSRFGDSLVVTRIQK